MGLFSAFPLILACLFLLPASLLAQEKRVALIIGNSEYVSAPRLENPKNDAADLSAKLEGLGFKVMQGLDLDKAGTDRLIRDFAEALSGAKVAVFFYAGHGLQVGGQNYLIPIDAKLATSAGLDFETVRLDLVQRTMERETSTNIIILDACRDNPLARNLARALGTRSTQIGRGLASVESGEGTLISFSTQPGNVALDGDGRNSPFASALLKHIDEPGEDLPAILINVRNDVMAATERRQVPWEHSAMTARFFFTQPKASGDQQAEIDLWNAVKDSSDPNVVGSYLRKYPQGLFAVVAGNLINALRMQRDMLSAAKQDEARRQAELRRAEEELQKAKDAAKTATTAKPPGNTRVTAMPSNGDVTAFDGVWRFSRKSPGCKIQSKEFTTSIRNGRMLVAQGEGTVRGSGEFAYTGTNEQGQYSWTGQLQGTAGQGRFSFQIPSKGFRCDGTVTANKVSD